MATRVIWHPQARHDLLEIYIIIALHNPSAAERLSDAIEAKAETLARHPAWDHGGPTLRAMRLLVEYPYLILYETHPNTDWGPIEEVEIIRVADGRRDLTNWF